jgi:GMP synthase (glutamine-hydrolysing)
MRALFLQYEESDGPELFGDELAGLGVHVEVVRLDQPHEPIHPELFDLMIGLGGAMNADEVEAYPFLLEARAALRAAVETGTATLGICLSAQVMARAFGAPVERMQRPEIGLVRLRTGAIDDPLLAGLGESFPTLQFHEDTFELPEGITALASSPRCGNQVARFGGRAWAVQFHPEVSPATFAQWIESDFAASSGQPAEVGRRMIEDARVHESELRAVVATLACNLVAVARERRPAEVTGT